MKLIIITGASKGLGNALSKLLIQKTEYYILGISRSKINFDKKVNLIKFKHLEIDLTNPLTNEINIDSFFPNSIVFEEIIFINNAGIIQPINKIPQLDKIQLTNNINTNLLSPIFITKNLLLTGKLVHIVNISSGAALRPIEGWALYCTAKAGIRMFFDVYEKENPSSKVLHIDPGVIDTDMQKTIRKTSSEAFPLVENFINLKKEEKLKTPLNVAQNIFKKMKGQNLI